jgi:uncharacterized membrane protein YoaK (UPF0700 family)
MDTLKTAKSQREKCERKKFLHALSIRKSLQNVSLQADNMVMSQKAEQSLRRLAFFNWFLLSFLAGSVNAGGYLACHRFVTHVTGFATLFGVDVANGKLDQAIGILSVPVFFVFGAMVSAYLVDRRYHQGKKPHYAGVMALVALCLLIVTAGGVLRYFSGFGDALQLRRDYFFLALLCAASGLQNAAITTASGAAVRTTHLTGITTDLAIGFVRARYSSESDSKFKAEMRSIYLRLGTIVSFILGSVVGAYCFVHFGYWGFLVPASIAIYEMTVALRHEQMFSVRNQVIRGEV